MTTTRKMWYDDLRVSVPPGKLGDTEVETFEVSKHSLENILLAFQPGGRVCQPGTYTRLIRNGTLWMSDTTAELRDHLEPYLQAERLEHGTALVNGLGLGVIVQGFLSLGTVTEIDVVEIDADVIKLVGPHYEKLAREAGVKLTIHEDDAYTIKWPTGKTWDIAWHNIWEHLCTDNLELHAKLNRRYGQRVSWQGCWGHALLLDVRRRDRYSGWWS